MTTLKIDFSDKQEKFIKNNQEQIQDIIEILVLSGMIKAFEIIKPYTDKNLCEKLIIKAIETRKTFVK